MRSCFSRLPFLALLALALAAPSFAQKPHNVIIFVADGLRRGSVTPADMPTFYRLRTTGVDFRNSHAAFPTFTTANASVIATGHALGDTGDYSNAFYTGTWLTKPEPAPAGGNIAPFIEDDEVLASLNTTFSGNYVGERTLLSYAREKGFNVASVGKLGPTAIQQIEAVHWADPDSPATSLSGSGATVVDDATGHPNGIPLPADILAALAAAKLPPDAPTRTNGFAESSPSNNAMNGDAQTPGTLDANRVQIQWFADVTTRALLPTFAADNKPFVLLFWSRDPDGTQHNQGDSLQRLLPGINGDTSRLALHNVDHALRQLLDWLDAHPAIKATTDVLVTSDHGFATVSRREITATGLQTGQPSAALSYEPRGKEKPQPPGTLPGGFLAVDLGIRQHLHVFDADLRSTSGSSVYTELTIGGERSQHPTGAALLGQQIHRLDGSDARLIVVANGGSDLLYVPDADPAVVHQTLEALSQLDYVGGVFVDDRFCPSPKDCPGALPLSSVGLVGSSRVPRPAIVVTFKVFYQVPGDLQSAAVIADTTLQEGQGQHGAFGREQTLNNMAAIGPDFRAGFVDNAPVGNIDIAPTLAHILGLDLPSTGTLRGRIATEALAGNTSAPPEPTEQKRLSAPNSDGSRTLLEYQQFNNATYNDSACILTKGQPEHCR